MKRMNHFALNQCHTTRKLSQNPRRQQTQYDRKGRQKVSRTTRPEESLQALSLPQIPKPASSFLVVVVLMEDLLSPILSTDIR